MVQTQKPIKEAHNLRCGQRALWFSAIRHRVVAAVVINLLASTPETQAKSCHNPSRPAPRHSFKMGYISETFQYNTTCHLLSLELNQKWSPRK